MAGQRERELFQRAHFDALTGLPNRQLYYDRLGQAVAQARREEHRLAVLFIDLDGFKNVNDTLGHDAGDRVLQAVAERLRVSLDDGDIVARMGGDEFGVLIEKVDDTRLVGNVARKLLKAIADVLILDGQARSPSLIAFSFSPSPA